VKRILISAAMIGLVASPVLAATAPPKPAAAKVAPAKKPVKAASHNTKMVKKTSKTKYRWFVVRPAFFSLGAGRTRPSNSDKMR
jgi:hypothetical protein